MLAFNLCFRCKPYKHAALRGNDSELYWRGKTVIWISPKRYLPSKGTDEIGHLVVLGSVHILYWKMLARSLCYGVEPHKQIGIQNLENERTRGATAANVTSMVIFIQENSLNFWEACLECFQIYWLKLFNGHTDNFKFSRTTPIISNPNVRYCLKPKISNKKILKRKEQAIVWYCTLFCLGNRLWMSNKFIITERGLPVPSNSF